MKLAIGFAAILSGSIPASVLAAHLGLFDGESDVGRAPVRDAAPAGTARYDASTDTYLIESAGANTWYHIDQFHFLWKRASGDFALTAQVSFPPARYGHEPSPHRKGLLMFRESLDAGAAYADAAQHGSGMTALQYRLEPGANTQDIELNIDAPRTVRLVKRGDRFTLYLSSAGEPLHQVGASVRLHLREPFYVGLGALSHDAKTTDVVKFSKVHLEPLSPPETGTRRELFSTLETIEVGDQFRRAMVIRTGRSQMRSPNWVAGGKSIYLQEKGIIERVPYLEPGAGGTPQPVDTRGLTDCSGNLGLSPDGRWLAVSCVAGKNGGHQVYLLSAGGGDSPRQITRGSADKADIFTIPASGGPETRLTSDTINDGPDYTPDGRYIYFDSSRSGATQIWRMRPDGSELEQITADGNLNSSPHVSPDGKMLAFLSQPSLAPSDNAIGPIALKAMGFDDGLIRTVAEFDGNRDSFAMQGWGDGKHVAFVSYQYLPVAGREETIAAAAGSHESSGRPLITGVSHIAVDATDPARSERFYVHDLGAVKGEDPESAQGVRYYFSPFQFVEVLPLAPHSNSINRLDHVAFVTANAAALREYLEAQSVAVPARVMRGRDGSQWIDVIDPEGNRIEFVQPPRDPPRIPPNPLSSHMIHVGFIVHDRAREDRFFRSVLGFRPYWFGGMSDDKPTWISQQVPDGTDWLEYMIVGTPKDRGIPPTLSKADLGVLDHFSLGIRSAEDAYTLLWNGDRLQGQSNLPKIGRDAKWQLNLLDPDGTRAELMELHAIGTPCCSPFTGSDPQE